MLVCLPVYLSVFVRSVGCGGRGGEWRRRRVESEWLSHPLVAVVDQQAGKSRWVLVSADSCGVGVGVGGNGDGSGGACV